MVELGKLSYGKFKANLSTENWSQMNTNLSNEKMYADLLDISDCFICEDTEKEELVGMAFFVPKGNAWEFFHNDWAYIRMVGVHPKYEGQGIGTALAKLCMLQAKLNNEAVVALHTSELMTTAQHIYEKLGFKKLKELEPRYGIKYWLYSINLKTYEQSSY